MYTFKLDVHQIRSCMLKVGNICYIEKIERLFFSISLLYSKFLMFSVNKKKYSCEDLLDFLEVENLISILKSL